MRKRFIFIATAVCLFAMTGCGKTSTGNKELENAVYTNDYVSLAPYTGLLAEKKIYEVSEEAIDSEINLQLSDYADYESVDRPSQEGDWVYADYTIYCNGGFLEESIDEDYSFVIGNEDFGQEFDKKLTGVSTGDQLEFSITYEDDFMYDEWAGKTLDFTVDIKDVQIENLPECTDEFLQENMGYDNYEAYKSSVQESLTEQYEQESSDELKETLLKQVIDASSILQYTKDAYEKAHTLIESDYQAYAGMFGQSLEDLYNALDITEEDIEKETLDQLYRTLVVDAIIENENITLSDEEFDEGAAYYASQYGYDSDDDFLNDYSKDEIQERLLEDKVLNLLVDNAEITEVTAEHEDI